jgi:hypothetical protein
MSIFPSSRSSLGGVRKLIRIRGPYVERDHEGPESGSDQIWYSYREIHQQIELVIRNEKGKKLDYGNQERPAKMGKSSRGVWLFLEERHLM